DREIARVALCTLRAGRARAPGSACAAGSAVGPRGSLCADELREIDGRLLLLARVANDHDARLLDAHGSIHAARDERERGCSDGDETNTVHESSLTWRRRAGRCEARGKVRPPQLMPICRLPRG